MRPGNSKVALDVLVIVVKGDVVDGLVGLLKDRGLPTAEGTHPAVRNASTG